MWTSTAIDLLNDRKFIIKRISEQKEYIAIIQRAYHKLKNPTNYDIGRYFTKKSSAEYQLEIFEEQLKLLKP